MFLGVCVQIQITDEKQVISHDGTLLRIPRGVPSRAQPRYWLEQDERSVAHGFIAHFLGYYRLYSHPKASREILKSKQLVSCPHLSLPTLFTGTLFISTFHVIE